LARFWTFFYQIVFKKSFSLQETTKMQVSGPIFVRLTSIHIVKISKLMCYQYCKSETADSASIIHTSLADTQSVTIQEARFILLQTGIRTHYPVMLRRLSSNYISYWGIAANSSDAYLIVNIILTELDCLRDAYKMRVNLWSSMRLWRVLVSAGTCYCSLPRCQALLVIRSGILSYSYPI